MKTVFTGKEIDHVWVYRKAPHGRVGGRGNESFNGDRYLSYSTCIAERRTFKGVGDVYFVSRHTYSATTAGHISALLGAISGNGKVFRVQGVRLGSSEILPPAMDKKACKKWAKAEVFAMRELAAKSLATSRRARTQRAWHISTAGELVEESNKLAKLFGVRVKANPDLEGLADQIDEARRLDAIARKERQKQLEIQAKEALDKWLNGESNNFPSALCSGPTRLRVYVWGSHDTDSNDEAHPPIKFHKTVQTSLGINIDYREAELALHWLLSHRERGWRTNGEKFQIAGYDVSSVSEQGVVAGCHRVSWPEIERIAFQEHWL